MNYLLQEYKNSSLQLIPNISSPDDEAFEKLILTNEKYIVYGWNPIKD